MTRPCLAPVVGALAMSGALTACAVLSTSGAGLRPARPAAPAIDRNDVAPPTAWPPAGWWRNRKDPEVDALGEERSADAPDQPIAAAQAARARAVSHCAPSASASSPSAPGEVGVTEPRHAHGFAEAFAFDTALSGAFQS